MAGLPPDGEYVVQSHGTEVTISNAYDPPLLRFDASDPIEAAKAQKAIHDLPDLTDEQKTFAHFWSGYFHAHLSR